MARLQSYPLPVRVCLAVLDLCWALATLELRRIFDLLLLLARVKLHGRRVSRAGAKKWNVLVEWRRAVAEAPQAVAIARAEDRASPARLTYAEVDALSDEFAAWVARAEPGGAGAVALLMGNSCAFLVAWLGVAKAGRAAALVNCTLRGDALAHALGGALGAARATLCVADADLLDVAAAALGGGGRAFAVDGVGGPAVNATTPETGAAGVRSGGAAPADSVTGRALLGRRAGLHLHVGHDGPPEGGADHARPRLVRRHGLRVALPPRAGRPLVQPAAVWKSTTGLGRPDQTLKCSISIKSKSTWLIFGRLDCSRRVLEAQPKSLVRTVRLRAY